MSAAPPALLRRLLERSLPAEVRDGIVGDLDEVYRARCSRSGAAHTRLWYAGQALAISGRFAAERLGEALSLRGSSFGLDLKLIALSFWITFRGRWESRSDKVRAGRRRN